jgi:hypothetical protein
MWRRQGGAGSAAWVSARRGRCRGRRRKYRSRWSARMDGAHTVKFPGVRDSAKTWIHDPCCAQRFSGSPTSREELRSGKRLCRMGCQRSVRVSTRSRSGPVRARGGEAALREFRASSGGRTGALGTLSPIPPVSVSSARVSELSRHIILSYAASVDDWRAVRQKRSTYSRSG